MSFQGVGPNHAETTLESLHLTNDNIRNCVRWYYLGEKHRLPTYLDFKHINDWDVSKVTTMDSLFFGLLEFNEPLHKWDVSQVENMSLMFANCHKFNQDLSNWKYKLKNVTTMSNMFRHCHKFNQDLNSWDVSNVNNMAQMFDTCIDFDKPLNKWFVSNVLDTHEMFFFCVNFNQPLNNWDVRNIKDMSRMFYGCSKFNQPLDKWIVGKSTNTRGILYSCYAMRRSPIWIDQESKNNLAITLAELGMKGNIREKKMLAEDLVNFVADAEYRAPYRPADPEYPPVYYFGKHYNDAFAKFDQKKQASILGEPSSPRISPIESSRNSREISGKTKGSFQYVHSLNQKPVRRIDSNVHNNKTTVHAELAKKNMLSNFFRVANSDEPFKLQPTEITNKTRSLKNMKSAMNLTKKNKPIPNGSLLYRKSVNSMNRGGIRSRKKMKLK